MPKDSIVKASEIGEYLYCQRAWWLRMNDRLGSNEAMDLGTLRHNQLSEKIQSHTLKKMLAFGLIVSGLVLLIIIILSSF